MKFNKKSYDQSKLDHAASGIITDSHHMLSEEFRRRRLSQLPKLVKSVHEMPDASLHSASSGINEPWVRKQIYEARILNINRSRERYKAEKVDDLFWAFRMLEMEVAKFSPSAILKIFPIHRKICMFAMTHKLEGTEEVYIPFPVVPGIDPNMLLETTYYRDKLNIRIRYAHGSAGVDVFKDGKIFNGVDYKSREYIDNIYSKRFRSPKSVKPH